jgi:O-antigen/teichoic acid export membrane protein
MRGALATARHWVGITLGRAPVATDAQRRLAGVARGATTALVARGVGVLVALALVPISIGYVGPDSYGAWMTIGSCLAWLQMADLGVGNGLTNAIGEARGKRDDALVRRHVATAFWVLGGIAAALAIAFFSAWPSVDWAALFNVHDPVARREVGGAVAVATGIFLAAFPLSIVDRIYAAHDEGAIANAWSIVGSVSTLLLVVLVARTGAGLVGIVAAAAGTPALATLASAAWLVSRHRPSLRPSARDVTRASARRIAREAAQFFVVQVIAVVMFSTDNVIIARVLGADRVTPYSAAWRLFALPALFVSLYAPYLQPAYAEARARGDASWIARTLKLTLVATGAVTVAITVPLVLFGQPIIRIWAGAAAVPPRPLLLWMGAGALVLAPAGALGCMLNGLGRLRIQMVFGAVAAVVNVALSIALARSHGVTGVMAATVISYLACIAVPVSLDAARGLRAIPLEAHERSRPAEARA